MKPIVLDASAAAAWCIPDEQHDTADFHYAQARSRDGIYHAPTLWLWDVGNVMAMAYRRNRLPRAHYERGLEIISMAMVEIDMPPNLHRRSQVLRLAEAHALTYYDASYLELVVRLNGTLLSRDRALAAAAQACSISCIYF
ncbi:type II toxin-antitoxin system VapC family toxin [Variovorax terrae]|uniref:Type II toxin-antitoxin system VapC family toxin n=1 Tax=Variovorax terrae TaxID=2923278 RepID=A0A9X2AMD3_9BURK|nr:type II toxin-antitoxin system VapC family toxin [Variovorax terrae]MCJ0763219.1 type II toxin-antitoxin system VapC family toxin [Variovorax terrae]